jgi:ribosomal protein L2
MYTHNPKNRAMIGTLAGGGASERHFMSAGNKWRSFKAKGKKYPIVRGVAQAAYVHPVVVINTLDRVPQSQEMLLLVQR